MNYWLVKTEPTSYSIEDLKRDQKTAWDGVRNYQARNYMRDGMKLGDQVLFYHSSNELIGVVGLAEVASAPYADDSAFDPKDHHFDPKSDPQNPTWMLVDLAYKATFPKPVLLPGLKKDPRLEGMVVTKTGSRLSVQPVSEEHFKIVCQLAGL